MLALQPGLVLAVALSAAPQNADALQLEGAVLLESVWNTGGGGPDAAEVGFLLRGGLLVDGPRLGLPGLRVNLSVLAVGASSGHGQLGDLQGVSNIAAPRGLWPFEAWAQQNLGRRFSLLAGVYDVNSEFDALNVAALFLNSSFGIGADLGLSGRNGPSTYPFTGLALRLAVAPSARWRLRAAVADGTPGDPGPSGRVDLAWRPGDGALLVGELTRVGAADDPQRAPVAGRRFLGRGSPVATGKVGLGLWRYIGVRPWTDEAAWGAYVLAETGLPGPVDAGVFGRAGLADGGPVKAYTGAGVTARVVPDRPGDEVGIALAVAWPDRTVLEGGGVDPRRDPESVVELSYRLRLSQTLFLQPDLQYVVHPTFDPHADRALVLILRAGMVK